MIRSEKQHQAAKKQLASLREALARKTRTKAPEALIRAAQGQTVELAGEIERQIKDYEQLQKTRAKELHIFSLHDLRVAPIRYRIAAHMTIESFARLVHVHSNTYKTCFLQSGNVVLAEEGARLFTGKLDDSFLEYWRPSRDLHAMRSSMSLCKPGLNVHRALRT